MNFRVNQDEQESQKDWKNAGKSSKHLASEASSAGHSEIRQKGDWNEYPV